MQMRTWILAAGVVLVAGLGTAMALHHQGHGADRGKLTASEYDRAVAIARSIRAEDRGNVSSAVAYIVNRRVQTPDIQGSCNYPHVLVVSVVGDFPNIDVSPAPGAPTGPDMWVTARADALTGNTCVEGVSLGKFQAPPGSANLLPAI